MHQDGGQTILELINSLINKNEIKLALKILEELKYDKKTADSVNYFKALCYLKLEKKDYHKALLSLNEIKPENKTSDCEYLKYFCYFKLENYEAIVKHHIANEAKLDNVNEKFKMLIAISFEKLNLTQYAKNIYKKIIQSNPNNKEATNNLAILEMRNSNSSSSISFMKNCYTNNPNNLAIANNYALCLIKNNSIEDGLNVFEKILSQFDSNTNNRKEKEMYERIKRNYFHNSIKFGKGNNAEKLIETKMTGDVYIESLKILLKGYISYGKIEEADEIIKKIKPKDSSEKNVEIIDKLILNNPMIENTNVKHDLKIDIRHSANIEMHKCEEFSIQNIHSDSLVIKEEKTENKSKEIELNKNIKEIDFTKADKDCVDEDKLTAVSPNLMNYTLSPDSIQGFVYNEYENKSRNQSIYDCTHINNIDKNSIFQDKKLQEIITAFYNTDYPKCRELIDDYRMKITNKNENIILAQISAKLYNRNKDYSKVIDELKKYLHELDEENLKLLVSCSKQYASPEDYFMYLEKMYLKYNPKDETLIELIITSIRLSDKSKLKRFLANYLKFNSNEIDHYRILNALLSDSNFIDYSLPIIEKLKYSSANATYYLYYYGIYNLKKPKINQAYENFLKIESQMKNNAEYIRYLAKIHIKLRNFKKAIKNFKILIEINRRDWDSFISIAKCLINLEDYSKANKYINLACKINAENIKSLKINFIKGLLNLNKKELNSALEHFEICIRLHPNNFKVLHYKAMTHLLKSEISQAKSLFEQVISLNKKYFPSHFELFKLKLITDNLKVVKVKDLIDEIAEIIEVNCHYFPKYSLEYAEILVKYSLDYNKAIKYFEIAVKKGKNSLVNQALRFADILQTNLEITKAIKCYHILLEVSNKDYRIYKELKNIFCNMKRYDEAIKTIRVFIKNTPNSVEANADLGDLFYNRQNYNKAADYYVIANNLNKQSTSTKFKKRIALCRINLKHYETAFKILEDVSKVCPEENIFLLMACVKLLYFDCEDEANTLLKKEVENFPTNNRATNILSGKMSFSQFNMEQVMIELF